MDVSDKQPNDPEVVEDKAAGEDRLVMLCDGIFAIAITLLVLDIKVPPLSAHLAHPEAFVNQQLATLQSSIITYLISFFVIAIYWMIHRRMMRYIKRIDSTFIWLTFLFMAFIVFFPVSFNVVSAYGDYPAGVIFYTLVMAGCGFTSQLIWLYACWNRRLIDSDLTRNLIIRRALTSLSAPIYFSLSLLLLLIPWFHNDPSKVYYTWPLLGIGGIVYHRLQRLRTTKQNTQPEQLASIARQESVSSNVE